ncbi:MAG: hypothetical protein D6724_03825 [Armatimonadetes bacterium]|nr:MAG: hypothetical protein D6724_03825 [Armatimonadota bacterium]
MAVVYESFVDILCEPEAALEAVGNLYERGHYLPSGVMAIRELAPKPFSESGAFLPGQRVSYLYDGKTFEHEVTEVRMWDEAEANVKEVIRSSSSGEMLEWRLSELTPGTIRVTLMYHANVNPIAKMGLARFAKRFWGEALQRLKVHLEDKKTFSGPRTWVPKSPEL